MLLMSWLLLVVYSLLFAVRWVSSVACYSVLLSVGSWLLFVVRCCCWCDKSCALCVLFVDCCVLLSC